MLYYDELDDGFPDGKKQPSRIENKRARKFLPAAILLKQEYNNNRNWHKCSKTRLGIRWYQTRRKVAYIFLQN